jgi:hypothetical protein
LQAVHVTEHVTEGLGVCCARSPGRAGMRQPRGSDGPSGACWARGLLVDGSVTSAGQHLACARAMKRTRVDVAR